MQINDKRLDFSRRAEIALNRLSGVIVWIPKRKKCQEIWHPLFAVLHFPECRLILQGARRPCTPEFNKKSLSYWKHMKDIQKTN